MEIVSTVWNGQIGDHSCLLDDTVKGCPKLDINDPTPVGGPSGCLPGSAASARRDGSALSGIADKAIAINNTAARAVANIFARADSCPVGPRGATKTITIRSGTPSPTCTANCGKLCKGAYCDPAHRATGVRPPDFSHPNWFPSSTSGYTCASSATLTSIGGPAGAGGQATITSSGCATWKKPKTTTAKTTTTQTTKTTGKPATSTVPFEPPFKLYPYTWHVYMASDLSDYFQVFPGDPNCKDVLKGKTWVPSSDLSGGTDKYAIRCKGFCQVCFNCDGDYTVGYEIEMRSPKKWVSK